MNQADFRDLIIGGKVTYSGENTLMYILNYNRDACLKHLERIKMSEEEAIIFLEKCKELLDKKVQWLSGTKCPDKVECPDKL